MRRIDSSEAAGKTVAAIAAGYKCVAIRFKDGTYVAFSVSSGYEYGDIEIDEEDVDLMSFECGKFLDVSEYYSEECRRVAERESKAEKARAETEIREREEFDRLRKKYG